MDGKERANALERQVDRLLAALERMHLQEYVEYVSNRKRLLLSAFVQGMARGFGFAVGFSILGAVVVVLLRYLVVENIPLIGSFLAEVIYAVQERR